jgi:hypothetical protein
MFSLAAFGMEDREKRLTANRKQGDLAGLLPAMSLRVLHLF